jgi:hypothetical protein
MLETRAGLPIGTKREFRSDAAAAPGGHPPEKSRGLLSFLTWPFILLQAGAVGAFLDGAYASRQVGEDEESSRVDQPADADHDLFFDPAPAGRMGGTADDELPAVPDSSPPGMALTSLPSPPGSDPGNAASAMRERSDETADADASGGGGGGGRGGSGHHPDAVATPADGSGNAATGAGSDVAGVGTLPLPPIVSNGPVAGTDLPGSI